MTGWLPDEVTELFGADATADESYDLLTVDVPADTWTTALHTARATLGCSYFDWLSAVDEPGTGFRVCAHVVALHPVRRLLVRTTVPHSAPVLASAVQEYAGAAWHERETHEMFGIDFTGHPGLDPLLLPDTFEGHPLRKDFVLASRVAKAWPGAKEPGESEHGGPRRRQMLPPGVPDPNEWGPLKGQLPPAPARSARGARAGAPRADAGAAGERPARRTRTASAGSAGQAAAAPAPSTGAADAAQPDAGAAPARRTRSASEGSAGRPDAAPPTRRTRSASQGSASQHPAQSVEAASMDEAKPGTPDEATPVTPVQATPGMPDEATPMGAVASGRPDEATPMDAATSAQSDEAKPGAPTTPEAATPEPEPAESDGAAPAPTADAPWHHPRPAFTEPAPGATPDETTPDRSGPDKSSPDRSTPDAAAPDEDTPAGGDPA